MLTTLDDVKAVKGIPLATTTHDAVINAIIASVSAAIAQYCRRSDPRTGASLLERAVDRIEYPASMGDWIKARLYPIESVAELIQASDRDFANATPLVEGTDFLVSHNRSDKIVAINGAIFIGGVQVIRLTFTGGYFTGDAGSLPAGATPLPADLKWAATQQAYHEFARRESLGEDAINIGDMNVSRVKDGLLTIVKEKLAPYVDRSL